MSRGIHVFWLLTGLACLWGGPARADRVSLGASIGALQPIEVQGGWFPQEDGVTPSAWQPTWTLTGGLFRLGVGSGQLIAITTWEMGARWIMGSEALARPQRSGWLLAGGLGYRYASLGMDLSNFSFNDERLVSDALFWWSCLYLGVRVGYQFSLSEHWTIGTELGLQIPFAYFGGLSIEKGPDGQDLPDSVFEVRNSNFISRVAAFILPEWRILTVTYGF